jgi:phosphatidylserine/phosphatidylglycerophosphate/cardiolipin synthase-like enzyme
MIENAKQTIDVAAYYISLRDGDTDGSLVFNSFVRSETYCCGCQFTLRNELVPAFH